MAPSNNRRPGNSRRAQYTTFFSYFAGVLGAGIGLLLLVISIANPHAFSGLVGIADDVTSPPGQVGAAARSTSKNVFEVITGYVAAGTQNAHLKRELAAARTGLIEAQATANENRRLKALLDLSETEPDAFAVARLTSSTAASTRRLATVSAGSNRGILPGMPVRSQLGLVGRVLSVSAFTARVLLVTDSESVVPVRRASDGVAAFAQGRGDGSLQLRLINLGINPLKVGDAVVTSGSGGLYRPGIPLAVVRKLTRDGAIADVLANPAATDFVMVERTWVAPETPASTAPTPPAATPTGAP